MSDVLDYVRSKKPEFASVPDDELTSYLANRKPEFLKDPQFKEEYAAIVKPPTQEKTDEMNLMVDPLHPEQVKPPPEFSDIGPTQLYKSGAALEVAKHADEPLFNLVTPLTDEETERLRKTNPKALGYIQSITENANQLTTTKNLMLLGSAGGVARMGKLVSYLISLGFSAVMAKGVVDKLGEIGAERGKPKSEQDPVKLAKLQGDAAIGTLFTALPALHGLKPVSEILGGEPTPRTDLGKIDVESFRGVKPAPLLPLATKAAQEAIAQNETVKTTGDGNVGGASAETVPTTATPAPESSKEITPKIDPAKEVDVIARGPEGEDVTLKMKAQEAVDRLTKRKNSMQALLDCLGT